MTYKLNDRCFHAEFVAPSVGDDAIDNSQGGTGSRRPREAVGEWKRDCNTEATLGF